MAKTWQARLEDTYLTIGRCLGDEQEAYIRAAVRFRQDNVQEEISGCLSLGSSWFAKKTTAEYAERPQRRACVLLKAVHQLKANNGLHKGDLKTLRGQTTKLTGTALQTRMEDLWEPLRVIKEREDRLARETMEQQRLERLRIQQEQKRKMEVLEAQATRAELINLMKNWAITPDALLKIDLNFSEHVVPNEKKIQRLMFLPSPRHRGALTLGLAVEEANHSLGSAYWLPWASCRLTRIDIPAYSHEAPTPDLFFTAEITGCSVFVRGPASAPTVYHAGIDGEVGQGNDEPEGEILRPLWKRYNAVALWRQLLLTAVNADLHRAGQEPILMAALLDSTQEINKTHYIDDISLPDVVFNEELRRTTEHSRAFLNANRAAPNKPDIAIASPWGCVFGIRDSVRHEWTFYLQENLTLVYTKQGEPTQYATCIPLAIKKFFPAPGHDEDPFVYKAWDTEMARPRAFNKSVDDGIHIF